MICNGTANISTNIPAVSSKNHCTSAAASNDSAISVINTTAKPSPTQSLQVTMKDFDLLKVLGTGGNYLLFIVYQRVVRTRILDLSENLLSDLNYFL